MTNRISEWLKHKVQELHYGTITVTITVHQGEISAIDKTVLEKEKFPLTKK